MKTIKSILDEIANESGSNKKIEILSRHKDNETLKNVLYSAYSRRVKYYIKQIPRQISAQDESSILDLDSALRDMREMLSSRAFTGHAAVDLINDATKLMTEDDAFVFIRVLEKDLKLGMGGTSINKVFPKLIEKTPYMGAQPFSEDKVKKIFNESGCAISQVKMDGRYCNAIIRNGQVDLESRQGEITHVGDDATFLVELAQLDDCVLNGELTIEGFDRYTANGIITSIIDVMSSCRDPKKVAAFEESHGSLDVMVNRIQYTIWDKLTIEEYFEQSSDRPYSERLANITIGILRENDYARLTAVEYVNVGSYEHAMNHFQDCLQRGLEGTIIKSSTGKWKDGKPAWQVKMKIEMNLDLKIIGFEYGTKGSKNEHVIATLNLESSCGKLKTNPAGMNEKLMLYVTENQQSLLGTIVEIRCCGLTPANGDGTVSTLHPSIEELRSDKDTCDSLESAIEIENMAKGLKTV